MNLMCVLTKYRGRHVVTLRLGQSTGIMGTSFGKNYLELPGEFWPSHAPIGCFACQSVADWNALDAFTNSASENGAPIN